MEPKNEEWRVAYGVLRHFFYQQFNQDDINPEQKRKNC